MVRESVAHLKMAGKEVMLDLEHFFDGLKANAQYTMQVGCGGFHSSLISANAMNAMNAMDGCRLYVCRNAMDVT